MAVVEQIAAEQRHYAVRHLRRWPPGTAYPVVAADISLLVEALPAALVLMVDRSRE